jgi:hypothetical protein
MKCQMSGSGSGYFATDGQSASLSWMEAVTRYLLLLDICCLHIEGRPLLTRGRVCNVLLQFVVTLRFKSRRTHDHILPSHLRPYFTVSYETPTTCRARSLYLYPPGTGWPSYTPRALGSLFVASFD